MVPGWGDGRARLVDIVPIISVAGGLGLAQLRPNMRVLVFASAVVLSWVTVELMAGYWTGVLLFDNNTATQFWHRSWAHTRCCTAEAPGWLTLARSNRDRPEAFEAPGQPGAPGTE